ncbi:hypothetical protein OKW43_006463 [Paraburkholderia sp. WC7.3g]
MANSSTSSGWTRRKHPRVGPNSVKKFSGAPLLTPGLHHECGRECRICRRSNSRSGRRDSGNRRSFEKRSSSRMNDSFSRAVNGQRSPVPARKRADYVPPISGSSWSIRHLGQAVYRHPVSTIQTVSSGAAQVRPGYAGRKRRNRATSRAGGFPRRKLARLATTKPAAHPRGRSCPRTQTTIAFSL